MKIPAITLDTARTVAGAGSFLLSLCVIGALIFNPKLGDIDLFKSLAQAIVIQGMIGLVMAFLFTGKNTSETAAPIPSTQPAKDAAVAVADAATAKADQISGATE